MRIVRIGYLISSLVLLQAAPGCGAFSEETVKLSEDQIAAVATRLAHAVEEIPSLSKDSIKNAASEALGVAVKDVSVKVDEVSGKLKELSIKLPSVASEAGESAGGAALDSIAKNPTTAGLGAAALAAITAAVAAIARRNALKRGEVKE